MNAGLSTLKGSGGNLFFTANVLALYHHDVLGRHVDALRAAFKTVKTVRLFSMALIAGLRLPITRITLQDVSAQKLKPLSYSAILRHLAQRVQALVQWRRWLAAQRVPG